jgi:hypothetical protein
VDAAGAGVVPGGAGGSAGARDATESGGAAGTSGSGGSAGSEGYCSSRRTGGAGDAERIAPPAPNDSGVIELTLDPCTLEVFSLPIDSVRTAASGYDPAARICASIIWDFSNNDIESELFCGDFVAPVVDGGFPERVGFPYVLLQRDQDAPCRNFWEYGGPDAISASGCIDPRGKRVEAQVEVEVDGTRYLIRARSRPPNLTP